MLWRVRAYRGFNSAMVPKSGLLVAASGGIAGGTRSERLFQRRLYCREGRFQLRAETCGDWDDGDRNPGCDQPIFDGGHCRLITKKVDEVLFQGRLSLTQFCCGQI
jgi:hypothetical protein